MEITKISFRVEPSDPGQPLGFEAWVGQQQICDIDALTEAQDIDWQLQAEDGDHELRLVLKHKTDGHTKIDPDTSHILADSFVSVKGLRFEDIDVQQILCGQSQYCHDFNGHGPATTQQFFGDMGCNGTVTLKFSTPVYVWMLDHI